MKQPFWAGTLFLVLTLLPVSWAFAKPHQPAFWEEQACNVPSYFSPHPKRSQAFWNQVLPVLSFLRPSAALHPVFAFGTTATSPAWEMLEKSPQKLDTPAETLDVNPRVFVRLATKEDMEQIYRITYQNYLEKEYISEKKSQRLNHYPFYSWSKRTKIFVVIKAGTNEVLGSLSVTQDREKSWGATILSWIGVKAFPFEKDFSDEVGQTREAEDKVASLWRLVVRKDYQKNMAVVNALFDAVLDDMQEAGDTSFLFVCNGMGENPEEVSDLRRFRKWGESLRHKKVRSGFPSQPIVRENDHARVYKRVYGMNVLKVKLGARGLGNGNKIINSYLLRGTFRDMPNRTRSKWESGAAKRMQDRIRYERNGLVKEPWQWWKKRNRFQEGHRAA